MLMERNPYYRRSQAEHRELAGMVAHIEDFLSRLNNEASDADWDQLSVLAAELLEHVSQHFQQEEAGGYLEEAIARLPRLGPQATVLERQHAPLLQRLTEIVQSVYDTDRSAAAWQSWQSEFRKFSRALAAHEQHETALMDEAFANERLEV